jgi:hypothetical protein
VATAGRLAEREQHDVHWRWVKGHAGDPGNERADQLANRGVDTVGLKRVNVAATAARVARSYIRQRICATDTVKPMALKKIHTRDCRPRHRAAGGGAWWWQNKQPQPAVRRPPRTAPAPGGNGRRRCGAGKSALGPGAGRPPGPGGPAPVEVGKVEAQ